MQEGPITPQQSYASVILDWIGNIFAMFYFLTPLVPMIAVYREKLDFKKVPLSLLVSILFNCIFWIAMGVRINQSKGSNKTQWVSLIISNGFGLGVNLILFIFLLYKYLSKKIVQFLFIVIFLVDILAEIYYLCWKYVADVDSIGFYGMIMNILMYTSPAINIVYTTGKADYLPILTNFIGFLTAAVFVAYGIITPNEKSLISNSVNLFVISIQIAFWLYFFIKKPEIVLRRNSKKNNQNMSFEPILTNPEEDEESLEETNIPKNENNYSYDECGKRISG